MAAARWPSLEAVLGGLSRMMPYLPGGGVDSGSSPDVLIISLIFCLRAWIGRRRRKQRTINDACDRAGTNTRISTAHTAVVASAVRNTCIFHQANGSEKLKNSLPLRVPVGLPVGQSTQQRHAANSLVFRRIKIQIS